MTVITIPNLPGPVVTVDDDETFHQLLAVLYERSEIENELVRLSSAFDCLRYIDEVIEGTKPLPAILLVDVNMPGMDGFQAVQQIRSMAQFAKIPVIAMLSSSCSPDDSRRAVEAGANEYIEKPIRILSLQFTGGANPDPAPDEPTP